MVATTAMLVAREDVHPALINLLLCRSRQRTGGSFQKAGEFPSPSGAEILSKDADQYYNRARPSAALLPFGPQPR